VPGKITPSFWWRKTDVLKPGNLEIWSAEDILPFVGRVGTKEQAKCLRIETVVEVMKYLIEVIRAEKQLVGEPRRYS